MSETYTVQPGDYMQSIAQHFGFDDYKVIYDDAKNQALKTARPNPNILYPGDKVFIPDKDPGDQPADTDKKHKFVKKAPKATLTIYVRRNDKPWAKKKYKLTVGKDTKTGTTDKDGLVQQDIPVGETSAELTFTGSPSFTRKLNLAYLHPISIVSGVQMRLNNLRSEE